MADLRHFKGVLCYNKAMKSAVGYKKYAFFLLLVLVFFVFNFTGFSKDIKNFFYSFSSPLQKSLWGAGINASDFLGSFFEAATLKKENDSLRSENQELLSQIAYLKELEKENETLRNALGIGLEKDFQLMLCNITGKDFSQDSILIDRGSKDGVLKDLPVISEQKVVVGKIGEVYDNFSEVILISNKKSSFDAKIADKDIAGLVKGKGSLGIYFDLIPKGKEVIAGDLIVSTSLGGVFPKGLLVGAVKEVKKSDVEVFQTAEIEPSFNIGNANSLFIITSF